MYVNPPSSHADLFLFMGKGLEQQMDAKSNKEVDSTSKSLISMSSWIGYPLVLKHDKLKNHRSVDGFKHLYIYCEWGLSIVMFDYPAG